jgi:uncharacterized protein (UPF0335 family)
MAPPQDGPSSANGGRAQPEPAPGLDPGDTAPEEVRLERLPALAARIAGAKAKVDEARGEVGGLYSQAEADGYHRRALREALRLADMEPAQLRDYLTNLNAYCDKLGVFAQGELFDPMPRPPAPPPLVETVPAEAGIATRPRLVAAAPGRKAPSSQPPSLATTRRAQGRADALQGFNETKNPWPEGSRAYASYREGWAEGNAELEAKADKLPKRRSRRPSAPGPDPGGKPDEPQLGV